MRRSKEEIPCKFKGQIKVVIQVEAKVAFKLEILDEVEEMLLETMVETIIKEVFVEEEKTRQTNGIINLKFDVIIAINLAAMLLTTGTKRVAK